MEQAPYIAGLAAEHDSLTALETAGTTLRDFRSRTQPDYSLVKDHITGQRPLIHAPPRASFGLPLAFRYRSLQGDSCSLEPAFRGHDRFASPLHIRIVQTQSGYHPVFLLMDGEYPGTRKDGQREWEPMVARVRRGTSRLEPIKPEESAVVKFMQFLEGCQ